MHNYSPLAVYSPYWGLLVTLGVLGEVWFSKLALRTAEEISGLADSDVALANERAAQALERSSRLEQATAEANLERKKLELTIARRTVKRFLDPTEEAQLIEGLSKHAGQRFTVIASMVVGNPLTHAARSGEQMGFAQQLDRILRAAGWLDEHALELDPGVFQGITVFFPQEDIIFSPPTAVPAEAAYTLCQRLSKLQIDCLASEYRRIAVPLLVISVGLL